MATRRKRATEDSQLPGELSEIQAEGGLAATVAAERGYIYNNTPVEPL